MSEDLGRVVRTRPRIGSPEWVSPRQLHPNLPHSSYESLTTLDEPCPKILWEQVPLPRPSLQPPLPPALSPPFYSHFGPRF